MYMIKWLIYRKLPYDCPDVNSTRIDKYCSIDFTPILRLHFVIVKYYDQINLYVSGLFYWHFTYPLIPFVTIRQPCKNICKCISWIRRNWPYEHNKNVGIKTVSIYCVIHRNFVTYERSTHCKNENHYKPGAPYTPKLQIIYILFPRFPESVQSIHHSLQIYLMTDTMLQCRRKGEPNSMRFNVIVSITLQRIYRYRIHKGTLCFFYLSCDVPLHG